MKRFLTIALFLTLSAIGANAQCDTDAIAAVYKKFVDNHKGTPEQTRVANEAAKEYLSKFGECPGDAEKAVTDFIKKWQVKYDAAVIDWNCTNAVDKTPAKAFELCQPLLAKDPESLRTNLLLSLAGIKTASDLKVKDQTVKLTRKTLDLIKSGKSVERWIVGESKDETVATLEFYSAYLTLDITPADTATTMLNLARSTTSYSKDPSTYFYLGRALESDANKQISDYKQKCGAATTATPECDGAFAKIESVIDRVIDAHARAVSLGAGKPEHARVTAAAKLSLTEFYKQRHESSEAGLDKYVGGVLSRPIP